MKDRIPKYPGRVKITHADGTSEYVTLERADEPVSGNEGTPLNKATLLSDDTAAELKLTGDDPTVNDALKKLKTDADAPAFCYLFDVKKAWLTSSVSQSEFKIAMAKAPDSMEMFMGSAFISPDLKHVLDIKVDRTNYRQSFGQYRIGDININTGEITWSPTVTLPAAYSDSYAYTYRTVCDIDNDGVVIIIYGTDRYFKYQYIDFATKSATDITNIYASNQPDMNGQPFDLYSRLDSGVYFASRHNNKYILMGIYNSRLHGYDKINKIYVDDILSLALSGNRVFIKCPDGIVYEPGTDDNSLVYQSTSVTYEHRLPLGDADGAALQTVTKPDNHLVHYAASTFASGTFLHACYKKTVSDVSTYYELTYDLATIDSSTNVPKLLSVASKVGEPPFGSITMNNSYENKLIYMYDNSKRKLYGGFYKGYDGNYRDFDIPLRVVSAEFIKTRNQMFDYDTEEETHLYIPRTIGALTVYGLSSNELTNHTFIKIPWFKNVVLSDFGLLWIDADNLKAV
nr:MAG TPA: hypothetical protein [Caudoviricetes sp.]